MCGFCVWSLFCVDVHVELSSFAIILLHFDCVLSVFCVSSLLAPMVDMCSVIVAFSGHTHLIVLCCCFILSVHGKSNRMTCTPCKYSNQPGHMLILTRYFDIRIKNHFLLKISIILHQVGVS